MNDNPALKLLTPQDVRYSCQGCGRCCSGWSVGLTEQDYNRVKDVDWKSLHPELAKDELFFHREQEFLAGTAVYPHYTKPNAQGSCPFLIDDLCFIHGHLGGDHKPVSCQIFPYTLAETPTGVYAGVVYTSMAAVRNIGTPLSEQGELLEHYLQLSIRHKNETMRPEQTAAQEQKVKEAGESKSTYSNPFEVISLTPNCQISWEEYLHIENRIIALLLERVRLADEKPEECNIFDTIIQCSDILMQGRKLKLSGGNIADIANFTPERREVSDITPGGPEKMILRMLFYRFLVYPTVRTSDSRVWQMQKDQALKGKNASVTASIFSKYAGAGLQTILFGKAKLPDIGEIVLDQAIQAKLAPLDSESSKLFHRWLYIRIFAKSYFGPAAAGFSVLSGFNCMTAGIISVMLFAKGAALRKKAPAVAIADLYEAYWRLDRELLTIGQIPVQESRAYNTGLSQPRLFNKSLLALARSFS